MVAASLAAGLVIWSWMILLAGVPLGLHSLEPSKIEAFVVGEV